MCRGEKVKIELVSIGDELLKGLTLNTNTTFLSRQFLELGCGVFQQTTVSDERSALKEVLQQALTRSDLVITTGGLGPTIDDQTRGIAAELFGSDFAFNELVAKDLRARFGEDLPSLQDQATVPTKAKVIFNRVGTAPGLIFHKEKKWLILLPGVPQETEPMFKEQVVPFLTQEVLPAKRKHTLQLSFCLLYESLIDPFLRECAGQFPTVEIGIYPAYGTVRVVISSYDEKQLHKVYEALKKKFSSYIYESKSGKIEEALQSWFVQHGKTLAFAESCTGGAMASALTALPGASEYFLGSFVVYSNELKTSTLGVSGPLLEEKGAVSEEAVRADVGGDFPTF